MVAAMDVAPQDTGKYGIIDVDTDDGALIRARGLVEKPDPGNAPSSLAVIGRYILTPAVLSALSGADRGSGGEIQLTDAIAAQARTDQPVYGFRFQGTRFDCGSKAGYLQATIAMALERSDLRGDLRDFLKTVPHRPAPA